MNKKEQTGRAIIEITKNNIPYLISIKRNKIRDGKNKLYYTFPGGHVEDGESFEDATIREVLEELGIHVQIESEFLEIWNEDLVRGEKFFFCRYISGELGTGTGEEWGEYNAEYGSYEIVYLELSKLEQYPLLPLEVRDSLIKYYQKKS